MPAGPLLLPAFSPDAAAVVAAAEGKRVPLALERVDAVARVVPLLAEKAVLVPALGEKLVETIVVLGASDVVEVEMKVDVVVATREEEVVVGGTELLVVGGTVLLLLVDGTEVVVGMGTSEVSGPVTPCLVAQSPRFMPLGQQKVSVLVS